MMSIPVIDVKRTGENIRQLRKKCGLSVNDLQKLHKGISVQAIYHWESGIALPTIDNLVVLTAIFEVRLEDILIFKSEGESGYDGIRE